jgi:hypothetical protein
VPWSGWEPHQALLSHQVTDRSLDRSVADLGFQADVVTAANAKLFDRINDVVLLAPGALCNVPDRIVVIDRHIAPHPAILNIDQWAQLLSIQLLNQL